MAYKIWVEDKQQPNGYLEQSQAPQQLQQKFDDHAGRLKATGHYVVLVHGGSVRAQEAIFFDHPDSARVFYRSGFKAFERFEGEYQIARGFYKVELFIDGWCETFEVETATPGMYDFATCRQCLSPRADWDFASSTFRREVTCGLCGYEDLSFPSWDAAGRVVWHYETKEGFGVLAHVPKDGIGWRKFRAFTSDGDVQDSANWLRQQIAAGTVCAIGSYVTRWNSEDKMLEFVVGSDRQPTYMPGVESV